MNNQDVASTLDQMADMLQIVGANRFRVNAFVNAAEAVRTLSQDINQMSAEEKLLDIQGVGKGIAVHIQDLLDTGTFTELEDLKLEVPSGLLEILQIPDVGPKTVRKLWQELNITSIDEIKRAAEEGKIRALKGFGAKSEEKILKGIALMAQRGDERTPIGNARPLAESLVDGLRDALPEGTLERIEIAGSLRRWRETIGDLDILVVSQQPSAVMEAFRSLPQVSDVIGSGETKTSVILAQGLQADLRVVERQHWGAAMQYFTGSQAHNIAIREIAQKQGWSLNEYGLTAVEDGKDGDGPISAGDLRTFEQEADLYNFLGLSYPPPELRENRGEIQAIRQGTMPSLIQLEQIQGELHGHSTWSDGRFSIEEMAEAARAKGYTYWAVCDHSVGLGVTQGVDSQALQQQAEEIAAINQRYADEGIDFRLLRGVEVEVLGNGTLGLPDEALAELDVVVASIHSSLRQDKETITQRCLTVVRNPHVDILGHPTGRLLGRRPPSELDVEQVLQVCLETGTVVEINAHPSRLDLNDVYARRAVELGCKIAINSDAHHTNHLDLMPYGIALARRAWVDPDSVVNTLPRKALLAMFKQ
ncbi:MAG: DNA polymerase/3'-5' exonuclease PolX [Chloroflexota bacterium]